MTTKNAGVNVSGYDALLLEYAPRPVRNARQYQRVLGQIDGLMRQRHLTQAEDNLLEVLAALVSQYEQRYHPAPEVTPGQMVAHFIQVRGITKAQLAQQTGIPRQSITNIVNGTRGISKVNRVKLSEHFGVSPEVFLPSE